MKNVLVLFEHVVPLTFNAQNMQCQQNAWYLQLLAYKAVNFNLLLKLF